ncbi:hypothetical protein [Thauera sinica]|uniref:hypothetical protein n=1 Tax=Thauera sp. K11 TaxID=2005884 RepID=UPI000BBB4868|nr:hypothetical protein [Thauera sp. K11]ATE61055.1 hypothetical protein CCZ27_14885 [Thauera sp. K11]
MLRWTSLLAALTLALAPSPDGANAGGAAQPAGAIEPPGPDLPPAGRSLFDELFGADADGASRLPFPFPALLQRIAQQLDAGQPSGGLSVVLIPLGRSLQRHAAGDVDAFRHPRVVAAVTGEPPAAAPPGHPYLRDRLYVAYHEKAAALEVISYNEAAGRFEFQLVRNYREGAAPEPGYANRTLCLACHHNAAPIFSRQSWDETSASTPVAARLAATGLPYYGLAWRHGVDVPDAIDTAAARANLLGTAQRLWREGCAAPDRKAAVACRAEALRQALRHRLTDGRSTTAERRARRPALVEPLLANWRQRWPAGLAIPDPSLPNRQPFAGIEGGRPQPSDDELRRYADIAAAFDPLALRAPLETWPGRSAADAGRFVAALSMFFSRADVAAIDRALSVLSASPAAATARAAERGNPALAALADGRMASIRHIALSCSGRKTTDHGRLDLDCAGADGARLQARLVLKAGMATGGTADRLVLPGNDAIGAVALKPAANRRQRAGAETMRFIPDRGGRTVRTAGGEAIRRIDIPRPAANAAAPATATLELVADLAPLDVAIDRLAQATLAGRSDALDDLPLRRSALLPALLTDLGTPAPAPPSAAPSAPRLADPPAARDGAWPPELQPFARQCGQCHAAATAFPPGFLRGGDEQVRGRIAACAERMLFRLAMNARPPAARPKTPMPPPPPPMPRPSRNRPTIRR